MWYSRAAVFRSYTSAFAGTKRRIHEWFAKIHPPPAKVGDVIHNDVDTPALCIDLDIFEKNCDALADRMLPFAGKVSVRPHVKAHKSPDLAKLQMVRITSRQPAVRCKGICCQKLSEAEVMFAGGIYDIVITNQIVAPAKIARLAQLSRQIDGISNGQGSISVKPVPVARPLKIHSPVEMEEARAVERLK